MSELDLEKKEILPNGWVKTTLREITYNIQKINPKEQPNKKFHYCDINSIDNDRLLITNPKEFLGKDAPSRARQLIKKDDVLFSTVRTYLKNIVMVPFNLDGQLASTGFCVLRSYDPIVNKLIFLYVQSNEFLKHLNPIQRGTNYPAVRNDDVFDSIMPIPPLNEQKRIVAKIEELFSKVDFAKQSLLQAKTLLKQYRQSLLKQAFQGKLTAKWREENKDNLEPASVLLEKIRREKGLKKTESSMSELVLDKNEVLPSEWIICKLEDITKQVNSGFPSGKHNKSQKGIPHIRPMNIDYDGNIDLSEIKYVEVDDYDKLRKGDVLFNNTNSPKLLGKTAVIKEDTNWAYSNHMTRIRFDISLIESKWISFYLHKLFWEGYYKLRATNHVNQSSINSTFLSKHIPILLAPLNEQKRIVAKIEEGFSLIENNEKIIESSLKNIDSLRQSILKQAFEGKLVPQDPNDEPASVLLEKIKQEKQKIINQTKSSRRKKHDK